MDDILEKLSNEKSLMKNSNDICTPMGCVREMLDHVPKYFWDTNPNILDPCCGFGNFAHGCMEKLGERPYTFHNNDIDDQRLSKCRELFGSKCSYSSLDFLENFTEKKWDLIVANPPYAKIMENGTRASKNHTLVRDFIKKSISILKPNGYIVFITPDNVFSLADRNDVCRLLTSLKIIHLELNSAKKKWFPKVGSSFAWYVVKNEDHGDSYYTCSGVYENKKFNGKIKNHTRDHIPLLWTADVKELLDQTIDSKSPKFNVETSSDLHAYTKRDLLSDANDDDHPWRIIHTPKQTKYSSRSHKYQDGWKVFISLTDRYKVWKDNCGMTQSVAFIRTKDEEEADIICEKLNKPIFRHINDIHRYGNFNSIRILQKFPKTISDVWDRYSY